MKNFFKISITLFFIILTFFLLIKTANAQVPPGHFMISLPIAPTVTTGSCNSNNCVSNSSATLAGIVTTYGTVISGAAATITEKGIYYWIPGTSGNTVVTLPDKSSGDNISQSTGTLQANTYNYQAYAINSAGITGTGLSKSFTISAVPSTPTPPVVQTLPATQITQTSAVMNGKVTSTGSSELKPSDEGGYGFINYDDPSCLVQNHGYANFDVSAINNGKYSKTITGLTPATTYYFVAFAQNNNSTSNGFADARGLGECLSFTTQTPTPTVNLYADPAQITVGSNSYLTWTSSNVTSCTASGDWSGNQDLSGTNIPTETLNLIKTYSYTLTCNGVSSTATVNVTSGSGPGPGGLTIAVSPKTPTIQVNTTQQFTTTINGIPSTAVTWSSTHNYGTIDSYGLYTSSSAGTDTVTATSIADPSKSDNATVTVTNSGGPGPGTSSATRDIKVIVSWLEYGQTKTSESDVFLPVTTSTQ